MAPIIGGAGGNANRQENKKGVTISHDAFLAESLVGRAGFEPATNGLKVRCSTS
jgi:hypothetical protein